MELIALDRTLKPDYRKRLGFPPFKQPKAELGMTWAAAPFCNRLYFQRGKLKAETPASRRADALKAARRRRAILRGEYRP